MHIVDRTDVRALPGTCMFCPGSVREHFIDTGIQIEFFGAVIICELCVIAMGQMFDMMTRSQVTDLERIVSEQAIDIFELQKQLAALEGIKNGLARAGFAIPDSSDRVAVPHDDSEGSEQVSRSEGSDVGIERGETSQSLHESVLARLHADADGNGNVLQL